MRPQQQNRRIRGRGNNSNSNNNNRKGPNPLTRTYESNGPDVKIRGTAQQIADKYATLSRDSQSSGDRVMAENYLQHAEHYYRIIAAAQAQLPVSQVSYRDQRDDDDELEVQEERQDTTASEESSEPIAADGSGPQPFIEGVPAEIALNERHKGAAGRANSRRTTRRAPAPNDENRAEQPVVKPDTAVVESPVEAAEAEAPKVAEAAAEAVAEAPIKKTKAAEEAKPVRRTRRPRVAKVDDAAVAAEPSSSTEEVVP